MDINSESAQFYFNRTLKEAMERQDFDGSEDLVVHVTLMLTKFIPVDSFLELQISEETYNADFTPLILQYQAAIANPDSTLGFLKFINVGDKALFIASAYDGSVHTKFKDARYCISMGEVSYGQAATIASRKPNLRQTTQLYVELSDKFAPLVNALKEALEPEVPSTELAVQRALEAIIKRREAIVEQEVKLGHIIIPGEN